MRGEERELTEEAEVLEDLETSELACVDLYGLVSQVQLRGKRLAFLFISLIGTDALQRVVFDRRRFDESSALGFPTEGSCEQCVHILAESALESSDLFAKRWEIFLPAATLPPISMATSKPGNALALALLASLLYFHPNCLALCAMMRIVR
ncbi:unnamed protein product [Cladocopium goreaui]|uniref:Reticulocyte-binding protein 2-like a n=1 Tax=Cladocopium goreaui TaxID=2562237 RepID=A0A9P1CAF6_9DINO|nr:unnamed protein product [Cladocopium goreaui]